MRIPRMRVMVAAVISSIALSMTPVVAVADPPVESCSLEQLQSLTSQLNALNARIAAHNNQSVDQTNAGAVAAYNARAVQLERERDQLAAQVRQCGQAMDNEPPPSMPSLPNIPGMPNIPGLPTGATPPGADGGVASRGSAPLYVWVAMSTGTITDENGNVSPDQGAEAARRYGIPDRVLNRESFAAYRGRTGNDIIAQYTDPNTGRWKWPANYGFEHEPIPQRSFAHGYPYDGFLDADPESGIYFEGTRYERRSLPPGTLGPYVKLDGTGKRMPRNYHLLMDIVGPAFGSAGGGDKAIVINTDTNKPVPLRQLIAEGYLRVVP
ncbi:hypothetical protein QSJ18_13340 [Gordonia sp. ABSL1-1]|uniref:hypothetical protein n=1 Tax=Gordonia sp. ABSL1-1 TaxID=3053923 RepID=UPI0025737135|nr:hypothetical protein [Gordonia sp. ABSL1-1]MDL9937731.1 hypothetical protein [Gordonia sp. ABSL1-1]